MVAPLAGDIDYYVPRFKIEINNTALQQDAVMSIDVDESIDKPGMFTLSLNEGLDTKTQTFAWLDSDLIRPGNKVLISFGYGTKSGEFAGKIKALSPGFPSTGIPTLEVTGYDLSHGMQKKESQFKDKDVKYSDIAKDIAGKNGLKSDGETIEDTEIVHTEKIKRKENESDYALLKRLAEEIGYEFFVRHDKLYFRKPKDDKKKDDQTFVFQYRKNFISFSPRLTTAPTVNEVEVTGWSKKSKKPVTATAEISEIRTTLGIPDFEKLVEDSEGKKIEVKLEGRVVESDDEAKRFAIAELKRANNGFIEGTLECIGHPDLRPGMNIEISGVGKRWFSGMYYIKGAKHSLGESGYATTVDVRRCL